ncbi:MAG: ABC transporter ATP-binding protein [Bradymonadia bacterium]
MPEANTHTPAMACRDLGHTYAKGPQVLTGVSLTLAPGSMMGVLGVSGSGKSTLLRAAAGFVQPTVGAIDVGGQCVCDGGKTLLPPERRGVGMVFQDYALFPHMTVFDNVAFGLAKGPDRTPRVEEMLEQVGLSDLRDRRPAALSGGQQQRVALARALAPRPKLLLLDEPFANLDAALRMRLGAEIKDLLGATGVGALLVTHDREEALGLADQVAVLGPLGEGQPSTLLQLDTPEQVYRHPRTATVANLTGEAAFLEGEGRGDSAQTPLGPVQLLDAAQSAITVVVRPEQLQLSLSESAGVPVAIRRRRFEGARYHLTVNTPAGPLTMEYPVVELLRAGLDAEALAPGQKGWLSVQGRCAHV